MVNYKLHPKWRREPFGKTLIGAVLLLVSTSGAIAQPAGIDLVVNHNTSYLGTSAVAGPAGGTFTYQAVVLHNSTGGAPANNVSLKQQLPIGGIFQSYSTSPEGIVCAPVLPKGTLIDADNQTLTCNLGTITNQDGSKSVSFDVILPSVGTNWLASASASYDGVDIDPDNNTNLTRNFTTNTAADLGIELLAPATVANGAAFDYTIKVTNYGPDSIPDAGRAEVTFPVPNGAVITGQPTGVGWSCSPTAGYPLIAGSLTCNIAGPVLAPGALADITVPAAANQSGSISGAASIAGFINGGSDAASRMADGQNGNNADDATVTVTGGDFVDVSLQKTVNPSRVDAQTGAAVTYTLTPRREAGAIQPYGMVLTDTLPSDVTFGAFASANADDWVCNYDVGTRTVKCTHISTEDNPYTGGNFAPMPAISFTATVAAGTGSVLNEGEISLPTALAEANKTNNSDNAIVSRSNTSELAITKTAPGRPVKAGEDFTFKLAVKNNGPMPIGTNHSITVTESPGPGLNIVGMTIEDMNNWACSSPTVCNYTGGLANGATLNVIVTANVTAAEGTHAVFTNSAGAGVTGRESTPAVSNASVTVSNETADIGIEKTVISPATGPIQSGDLVTYRLRVTNNSTATTVTGITVRDVLNNLVRQDEGGTIDTPTPGSFRYPGGGFVSATAESGATCPAPNGNANSESRTLVCTIASLEPLAKVDITVVIRPKVATNDASPYLNTATAQSRDINDSDSSNDTDTAPIVATALVDLVALKQVTPKIAAAGEPLTFIATVRNDGPSSAQNVRLEDTLPSNAVLIGNPVVSDNGSCTLDGGANDDPRTAGGMLKCAWTGDVPSRGQRTVTIQMRSLGDLPEGTVVKNEIEVFTSTPELNDKNNTAEAEASLTRAELDISIGMSHTADALLAGEGTRYTITVTNVGPSYATNVVMKNEFPTELRPSAPSTAIFSYQGKLAIEGVSEGITGVVVCEQPEIGANDGPLTCTIPVLPPGASLFISFDMNAEKTVLEGATNGTIYHQATVTADEEEWLNNGDDVIVNNSTSDRTSMSLVASDVDFGISKRGPTGPVDAGDLVTYTLTVTNYSRSTQPIAGGLVTDVLPVGLEFIKAEGCNYASDTRTVTCEVPQLTQGQEHVITLDTQLEDPYTGSRPLVNEASVSVPDDSNPDNDRDREETPVVPSPQLVPVPVSSWFGLILLSLMLGLFALRHSKMRQRD